MAALLRSTCGNFFADGSITSDSVDIEIWSGKAYLRNLVLDPALFQRFGVPLRVTSGFVGELCVELPWYGLLSRPVVVSLSGVILEVAPGAPATGDASAPDAAGIDGDKTGSNTDADQNTTPHSDAASAGKEAKKSALPSPGGESGIKNGIVRFLRRLVEESALNVKVELHDITIRYRDIFLPQSATTPKRFGVCVHLDAIVLKTVKDMDAAGTGASANRTRGSSGATDVQPHTKAYSQDFFFYHRSAHRFCKNLAIHGLEVYIEGDYDEGYARDQILQPIDIDCFLEVEFPTSGELQPTSVKLQLDVHAVSESAICADLRLSDLVKVDAMMLAFAAESSPNRTYNDSIGLDDAHVNEGAKEQATTTAGAASSSSNVASGPSTSIVVAVLIAPLRANIAQIGVVEIGPVTFELRTSTAVAGSTVVDAKIAHVSALYRAAYLVPEDDRSFVFELADISVSVGGATAMHDGSGGGATEESGGHFKQGKPITVKVEEVYSEILRSCDCPSGWAKMCQVSLFPLARCQCPVIHWRELYVQVVTSDCRERLFRPATRECYSVPSATDNPCPVQEKPEMLPTTQVLIRVSTDLNIRLSKSEMILICRSIKGDNSSDAGCGESEATNSDEE